MNKKSNAGLACLLVIIGLIITIFGGCHDDSKDKSSVSINAGYHSDYWYDRKHAKENAKKKVEELQNKNEKKGMVIYDRFRN